MQCYGWRMGLEERATIEVSPASGSLQACVIIDG
jgi:hypothetical protein